MYVLFELTVLNLVLAWAVVARARRNARLVDELTALHPR